MLAGFVDGRGRAYDIGFRTLRFSLVDEDGLLNTLPDESIAAQAMATVAMDLLEPRAMPFLIPTQAELLGTPRRIIIIAAKGLRRSEPFTFFRVALNLHPDAVRHFFVAQGGREYVVVEKADIVSSTRPRNRLEIDTRGPAPGKPSETARYRIRIEPGSVGEDALQALA